MTLIQVYLMRAIVTAAPNLTHIFLGLSLEELGMRELERLPRDRAIDGIDAFNAMRFVTLFPAYTSI